MTRKFSEHADLRLSGCVRRANWGGTDARLEGALPVAKNLAAIAGGTVVKSAAAKVAKVVAKALPKPAPKPKPVKPGVFPV